MSIICIGIILCITCSWDVMGLPVQDGGQLNRQFPKRKRPAHVLPPPKCFTGRGCARSLADLLGPGKSTALAWSGQLLPGLASCSYRPRRSHPGGLGSGSMVMLRLPQGKHSSLAPMLCKGARGLACVMSTGGREQCSTHNTSNGPDFNHDDALHAAAADALLHTAGVCTWRHAAAAQPPPTPPCYHMHICQEQRRQRRHATAVAALPSTRSKHSGRRPG